VKLGFSATRGGTTGPQISELATQLLSLERHVTEAHHGDCVGGDKEFHGMVSMWDIPIVGHPPKNPALRAYCVFDITRPVRDYVQRTRNIVTETHVLLAAPASREGAAPRSGTWAAIRYARKLERQVIIVYPDGNVTEERFASVSWGDC
jgi:hypothetical protein